MAMFFHELFSIDSTDASIFVDILVELVEYCNTAYCNILFVNSTNVTTNIETAALSSFQWRMGKMCTEVRFVHAVTAGSSVKFLPAV